MFVYQMESQFYLSYCFKKVIIHHSHKIKNTFVCPLRTLIVVQICWYNPPNSWSTVGNNIEFKTTICGSLVHWWKSNHCHNMNGMETTSFMLVAVQVLPELIRIAILRTRKWSTICIWTGCPTTRSTKPCHQVCFPLLRSTREARGKMNDGPSDRIWQTCRSA